MGIRTEQLGQDNPAYVVVGASECIEARARARARRPLRRERQSLGVATSGRSDGIEDASAVTTWGATYRPLPRPGINESGPMFIGERVYVVLRYMQHARSELWSSPRFSIRGAAALSVYAVLPVFDPAISGAHGPFCCQHELVHALAYRSYARTDVDESRCVISYISRERPHSPKGRPRGEDTSRAERQPLRTTHRRPKI